MRKILEIEAKFQNLILVIVPLYHIFFVNLQANNLKLCIQNPTL